MELIPSWESSSCVSRNYRYLWNKEVINLTSDELGHCQVNCWRTSPVQSFAVSDPARIMTIFYCVRRLFSSCVNVWMLRSTRDMYIRSCVWLPIVLWGTSPFRLTERRPCVTYQNRCGSVGVRFYASCSAGIGGREHPRADPPGYSTNCPRITGCLDFVHRPVF
jgi:hypothetical protein